MTATSTTVLTLSTFHFYFVVIVVVVVVVVGVVCCWPMTSDNWPVVIVAGRPPMPMQEPMVVARYGYV